MKKIIWRAFKIYLVGLFLWVFPDFDFDNIRWTGVLQRISFVFLFCGFIYLFIEKKYFIYLSFITLVIYWAVMLYFPVPGIGQPDFNPPGNIIEATIESLKYKYHGYSNSKGMIELIKNRSPFKFAICNFI